MAVRDSLSNLLERFAGFLLGLSKKLNKTDPKTNKFQERLPTWKKLWFVVDIPLFIDSQGVKKLYDALSRPEFETVSQTRGSSKQKSQEESVKISGKSTLGLAPFLTTSMSTEFGQKESIAHSESRSLNQEANRSPEMQFEKVIGFYAQNYPERIFWVGSKLSEVKDIDGESYTWSEISEKIEGPAPRPLIIFELQEGSKIIPMAGETVDSKFKMIYENYINQLDYNGDFPKYSSEPGQREYYWSELEKSFNSTKAMRAVEDSTKDGGRLDWIDYRLIGREDDEILPIHLHLAPRGDYNTGTFAYQTVRRGFKFGLKIIGTLKQGEDVNVLAMYEN
ncbi:MAG: hypothetical protein NXH96_08795 [Alteromonadaceae bacterium]|nr:hypothetical protein [Alteromonadaceae bacterium]